MNGVSVAAIESSYRPESSDSAHSVLGSLMIVLYLANPNMMIRKLYFFVK